MSQSPGQAQRNDAAAVWARVCETIRGRVGERNFVTWVAPLRSRWAADGFDLAAPDPVTRERVARHFLGAIEDALADALGQRYPVRLGLAAPRPSLPIPATSPSPDHTFDTFVVGDSNRDACAAAHALLAARDPAPLFLYGPSGVGKTHLLHAVFHACDAAGTTAACLSAAELVSAMVSAYEAGAHERFWLDLAPLGALLLDDIHSIEGREVIQERLLDGLTGWAEARRRLLLTSDRVPDDLPALARRLHERVQGSVAVIERPEPALRLAILHQKARARGVVLEPRLAARVAIAFGDNVRRLEGALKRLLSHAQLSGRPLDERLAVEVLGELRPRLPAPLTVDDVVAATAESFHTTARRLLGRKRSAALLLPRRVAMYLARELLGWPFAELGAAFGRDHTTVMQAWRLVAARRQTDRALAATLEQIERRLGAGTA
ncbi:MAG TPA: DnaA/Hda family protein [Candidatus Limnocylindria bacterium]|nr:DnaA/Hda family protein [Candidatus Limnocylindria bacterium]